MEEKFIVLKGTQNGGAYIRLNEIKKIPRVDLLTPYKFMNDLCMDYIKESQQILNDIAEEKDFEIMEMEVDKDHIHLLVNYNPTQSILDIVRLLKQISTYRIWRQNNNHIYLKNIFGMSVDFGEMVILLVIPEM